MKFLSQVYSAVSGSVGGLTYSHNRGGMYARARAVPTNPNTDPQASARDAMRAGVIAWGALTQAVRDAWEDYAANVPMLDSLGASRPLSGQQQFLRTYLSRTAASMTIPATAPTNFNLGTFSQFNLIASATTDSVDVEFVTADAWASTLGGYASVSLGRQVGPGVNFYRGPFAIVGVIAGAPTPPTSPETFLYGNPLIAGNKLPVRIVVGQSDGRVSTPTDALVTITT